MRPYLIQRAKFKNNPERKGIDSILSFDYMGSAEFEFGALPQSLKRIKEQITSYHLFEYIIDNKKIIVFCKKGNEAEICIIVNRLADNKFQLKEYCDFSDWIYSRKNYRNSNLWWDIKNDYMFWEFNLEFNDRFEKLIKK